MKEWTPLTFPAWIVWRVRRGATVPDCIKDDAGNRLCRWCRMPMAKSKRWRNWCGEQCVSAFRRVWSWDALRKYIQGRDKICQRCGSDWPGWLRTPRWSIKRGAEGEQCRLVRAPWQVDHIKPVQDGGDDNPDNLRLLCHPCHIAVGYEQRAARKAAAA